MNNYDVIFVTIIISFLALLLRECGVVGAKLCIICGGVVLFILALQQMDGILVFVRDLWQNSSLSNKYSDVILKVVGISVLYELASAVCKDNQHASLLAGLDVFSKTAVLALALPLFQDVVSLLGELLK